MGSAICGGNHSQIKTKKQFEEHSKWDLENGFPCIDCWCGIPTAYHMKKKKEDKYFPRKKVLIGYIDNFNFGTLYNEVKGIWVYRNKRGFKVRITIEEIK